MAGAKVKSWKLRTVEPPRPQLSNSIVYIYEVYIPTLP